MINATPNFLTANAALQKQPILRIEIGGSYSRIFTTKEGVESGWIESIEPQSTTVNDLDGGADLGELTFTVSDRGDAITGDFPSFTFEGKPVVLKAGFVGLDPADYVTLFTGVIDTVASANDNNSYTFTCIDNKQVLSKVIYDEASDDHPKLLAGHPLDLLISVLENEIGLAANQINIPKILSYKDAIFPGITFTFSLTDPPSARDFIEQQILKPLGGYMWVNNLGQIDVNFFFPNLRYSANGFGMIAAFLDGSGVIVGHPFPVPLTSSGDSMSVKVPSGATVISLGASDHFWTDNIGAWDMLVDAAAVHSTGKTRPWNSSANPAFLYNEAGSTSPVTTSVTPGATITITYDHGTVQNGVGQPFVPPLGDPSLAPDPAGPGIYAFGFHSGDPVFAITDDNIKDEGIPLAEQADLINTIHFRYDKDSEGNFKIEDVQTYLTSTARYGMFGTQDIESDGMRSAYQASTLVALTARLTFLRYGLKNLTFQEVPVLWDACLLEPGDIVSLTSAYIPDREAGVKGIIGKKFEVLDRIWDFENHIISVMLLDASYLSLFGNYLIAPNGMDDWTAASADDKATYMFMANDSDEYSDSSPAHVLG